MVSLECGGQYPPPYALFCSAETKALEMWLRISSRAYAVRLLLWPALSRSRWLQQVTLYSL